MRTAHEEPPKSVGHRKRNQDDYEYVIVEVTPGDLEAGQDKRMFLKRDGWEIVDKKEGDGKWEEYCPSSTQHVMRIPREKLNVLRKRRLDQAKGYAQTAVEEAAPSKLGSPVKVVEEAQDILSANEQAALDAMAKRALGDG